MTIIRELTLDEYQKWNDFVAASPQGSVFQRLDWIQMLASTDVHRTELLPLVCEEENDILGGVVVRYRTVSGKRIADLTPFGYNGPILAQKLIDPEKRHTYKAFSILFDLLKGAEERLNLIALENQPEVWDIRPFMFRSWHINTAYTHVLTSANVEEAWKKVHPDFQASIESARKTYEFSCRIEDMDIERFIDLSKRMRQKGSIQVLKKRIEWMRDHQRGQLYFVSNSTGETLAMALIVLSEENETAYILNTIFANERYRRDTEAYLFWQSYLALAGQFSRINIGTEDNCAQIHFKDNLGSELIPYFLTDIKLRSKAG